MLRPRALVLLAGLSSPLACASIYGVTTLPTDDGTDASTDAGGDGHTKPKPDASNEPDASHEAGHDAKSDTGGPDASDGSTGHDATDGSPRDGGPDTGQAFFASVTPSPITVVQGASANLTVNLTAPAAAALQVTLSSLPTGVTAPPITIGAGSTSGMLTLTASASATEGPATATIASGAASTSVDVVVAGAPASLDLSFNESGVQNLIPAGGSATSNPSCVAIQADDSILIGGSGWQIVRVLPDGSPDTAFNANVLDSSKGAPLPSSGSLTGIAVVPGSGLIALAGIDADDSETNLGILLLNADGSRHQSFGTGGLYLRGFDVDFHVTTVGGVAVNAAGTIAVDGDTSSGSYVITLSGPTNATFGESTNFPSGIQLQGIVYEPNGDIVVGGSSPAEGGQFFVSRLTSALAAEGFVDGGVLGPPTTPSSSDRYLVTSQIAADPSGNIFVAGSDNAEDPTPAMTFVANAGGSTLPNGYAKPGPYVMGGNGYLAIASGANDLAIVIGDGENQGGSSAFIARITSAGVLDSTFATAGVLEGAESQGGVQYSAVAIDSLNRIVVVGNDSLGYYVTRIWQ